MTTLSLNDAEAIESAATLPGKVLRAGGVIGLIAFVLACALVAIVWRGLYDVAAKQQTTLDAVQRHEAAVQQHEAGSHADRKIERQLQYAICRSLAKLSKSDAELCEVGR